MLTGLSIRNVVLIEALDLEFAAGLTALTGETGAGKSILLDSLGLALGGRSDARFVRRGAEQASVAAAFDIPPDQPTDQPAEKISSTHPVLASLAEHGLDNPDGDLILRRVLNADGRSKAFINDRPVSVGLLKAIGEQLVEVHGQFDQRGLLDTATHRNVLDAYGGHRRETAAVAATWENLARARTALETAERDTEEAQRDEDYLRHVFEELTALAPVEDEETRLAAERTRLANSGKLIEAAQETITAIGPESRADDALGEAARALEKGAAMAPDLFEPVMAALDRAGIELSEVYTAATTIAKEADAEPEMLQQVDDRLAALRDAARKHRCDVGQLPLLLERVGERLAAIDDRSGALAATRQALVEAESAYHVAAKSLSTARRAAAAALDKAVAAELAPLKLERARFLTTVDTQDASHAAAHGLDKVAFEVATTPGAAPGPIHRIASGGELARFMLALKVVLARDDTTGTLIFDEVDAGVGGATAAAVGDRLAELGTEAQVLVVTHSPQVAARAAEHWRVAKEDEADMARTTVDRLTAEERQEEIARMLSGAAITDEARAAATALMATGS